MNVYPSETSLEPIHRTQRETMVGKSNKEADSNAEENQWLLRLRYHAR